MSVKRNDPANEVVEKNKKDKKKILFEELLISFDEIYVKLNSNLIYSTLLAIYDEFIMRYCEEGCLFLICTPETVSTISKIGDDFFSREVCPKIQFQTFSRAKENQNVKEKLDEYSGKINGFFFVIKVAYGNESLVHIEKIPFKKDTIVIVPKHSDTKDKRLEFVEEVRTKLTQLNMKHFPQDIETKIKDYIDFSKEFQSHFPIRSKHSTQEKNIKIFFCVSKKK